ncbi:MAG: hypothetical protein IT236_06395 [Bacteroidia bacterium]|nr:hypothetical protein [Bacteroidia bacterium]
MLDVTLVCNGTFCGIAPGTDLMNYVSYINSIGHYSDVNDFITELNMRPKSYSYYQGKELDYTLVLWLKPNDRKKYTFTLNIVFKSGNEAHAEMDLIWR